MSAVHARDAATGPGPRVSCRPVRWRMVREPAISKALSQIRLEAPISHELRDRLFPAGSAQALTRIGLDS